MPDEIEVVGTDGVSVDIAVGDAQAEIGGVGPPFAGRDEGPDRAALADISAEDGIAFGLGGRRPGQGSPAVDLVHGNGKVRDLRQRQGDEGRGFRVRNRFLFGILADGDGRSVRDGRRLFVFFCGRRWFRRRRWFLRRQRLFRYRGFFRG